MNPNIPSWADVAGWVASMPVGERSAALSRGETWALRAMVGSGRHLQQWVALHAFMNGLQHAMMFL